MKVKDIIKRLHEEGWYKHRQEGDHRHYKHPDKPGRVTVSGHPSDTPAPKTLKRMFEQAGWEWETRQ